jgi:hypothetical protein
MVTVYEDDVLKLALRSKCFSRWISTSPEAHASWVEFKSDLGIPLKGGSTVRVVCVTPQYSLPITLIGYRY